ncbi:conserved phage C-terminal domain-containing protein [Chryseobacterium cucumeris]|uniref:conserved phage C-terminal domain-containing protein n=1 Tax=Chryseobacterium cucumeris TaxID=1813611 RepID=UPI001F4A4638|nr:conserved phage C-terminal domain-containing protein [Chryseobacterium cucumeris]
MSEDIVTPEIEILNLFNQITGHRHRPGKSNLAGIKRVLKEGYTALEIQEVIQLKTIHWKNDAKMSDHLNPVTVFRECNFDKYINQVLNVKNKPDLYAEHFKAINKISTGGDDSAGAFSKIDAMFSKRG